MRLLHEDELSLILSILKKPEDQTIKISNELRSYLNEWGTVYFIKGLEESHLIVIESIKLGFEGGYFEDTFLNRYAKLIEKGKNKEAETLAVNNEYPELNKLLKPYTSVSDILKPIDSLLDKTKLFGTHFDKDLIENIHIKFKRLPLLKQYLDDYLEAFRKDELEKPTENVEEGGHPNPYFKKDFYRYKKQRQIVVDIIKSKLETQNPKKIRIYAKELPLEHLNEIELLLCLEKEGLINESSEDEGKLEERAYWLLDVNENEIQDVPSDKQIKLDLSFSINTGILLLKDQNNKQHTIKIQGQVQKDVLRAFFDFPDRTFDEWSLYDIREILGFDDSDTKSVKNAIYQINKKVKLEIPEVDKFFEFDMHSARLNPKYLAK